MSRSRIPRAVRPADANAESDALREKVDRFPSSPGVYIMKDSSSRIIYIGKAVNLRTRAKSYLNRGSDTRVFYSFLVGKVADVDCIVAESEAEALILENNLIKKHRPVYNIRLKDDKTYVSIKVTVTEDWPRVMVVRRYKRDGNLYFGPYGSASSVREMLRVIKTVFPLRTCSNAFFKNRKRPCIEHEIGRCTAPCVDLITRERYGEDVNEVILFLKGRNRELLRILEEKMRRAAEARQYELAARYRDQMRAIDRVFQTQKAQDWDIDDIDVFATARENDLVAVQEVLVRDGKIINSHCHTFRTSLETSEVMASFLSQYYLVERYIPTEILCDTDFPDRPLLEEWLRDKRGVRVSISVPERGDKARLVELARKNALNAFAVSRTREEQMEGLLLSLQRQLALPVAPPAHRVLRCLDLPGGPHRRLPRLLRGGQAAQGPLQEVPDPHRERDRRLRLAARGPLAASREGARGRRPSRPHHGRRREGTTLRGGEPAPRDGGRGARVGHRAREGETLARDHGADLRAGEIGSAASRAGLAGVALPPAHPGRGAPLRYPLPPRAPEEGHAPHRARGDPRDREGAAGGDHREVRDAAEDPRGDRGGDRGGRGPEAREGRVPEADRGRAGGGAGAAAGGDDHGDARAGPGWERGVSRGKRRFTLLAAVVAVAIPVTLAVMLRHRIREEWWLHCLDGAEDEGQRFEILEEMSRFEHLSDRGLDRLTGAARDEVQVYTDGGETLTHVIPLAIRAGGAKVLSAILASRDEKYVMRALAMIRGDDPLPPGALSGALPVLDHSSEAVRLEAITALGDLGAETEDVVIALSRLLGDTNEEVRGRAEHALRSSTLDVETLLRHFMSIALDSNPERRRIGIRLLGNLLSSDTVDGSARHSIVLSIAGGLHDASADVRQEAARELLTISARGPGGSVIEPALPALIRALERGTRDLDFFVIDALAGIGKPAVPRLVALLEHGSAMVRLGVILALKRMEGGPTEAAIPALIERLSDVSPDVRETACSALGDLETKARTAGRALREHLDDGFESIRSEAACALWRVTEDGRAAAKVLKETALSRSEDVLRTSIWTLGRIGSSASAAVPNLRKLLEAKRCHHRLWAAEAIWRILAEDAVILERLPAAISCRCSVCPPAAVDICRGLGERAAPIIPACLALLEIPNTSIRTYAGRCLAYMGPAAESAVLAFLETTKDSTFGREGAREALRQIQAGRGKN